MLADLFDTPRPPALQRLVQALLRTPALWSIADTGSGLRDWIPAELRVFGRTGVDEGVVGVVFHCPEVEVPTWPVATYYRDQGADRIDANCASGARAFLASWRKGSQDLLRELEQEERPAVVPDGYIVRGTRDGLGVVVPADSWLDADLQQLTLAGAARRVSELVEQGRPGSALHVGRDALVTVFRQGRLDLVGPLHAAVADAYAALGRPHFARIARERAGVLPRTSRPSATATLHVDIGALVGDALAVVTTHEATLRADGPIQGQVLLTLRAKVVLDSGIDATVLLIQGWNGDAPAGPLMGRVDTSEGRLPLNGLPGSLLAWVHHLVPRVGS